jgi:type II secretory pathway component HofQ
MSIWAFNISTSRREIEATVILQRNEVEMISRYVIQRSLQTLAPVIFLLLCSSISAFAQSPSKPQELIRIVFKNSTVKVAIPFVGKQMGLKVVFDDTVMDDSLSIELTDVTPEQGLKLIFEEKKLQARIMEEKTIIVYPDDEAKHKKYEQYDRWPAKSPPPASRLRQSKPISFQNILSKAAIAVVGKRMGLIVEFDVTVKEDRLSIELTDVTLEQALKIILEEKKLQARVMEEKTIIVFPDNETNRKKYEQYEPWPPKSDGNK